MDPVRLGHAFRALRIRRRLRQEDVAAAVGVSRQLIFKIETGQVTSVTVETLQAVAGDLGASIDVNVRWHGEGQDRLLDTAHAGLVERLVERLSGPGWETVVEASFAIRGERGSIDVLALERSSATVLVVEVKSVVPDSQATIQSIDRKVRLAREIARQRDWPCRIVARLLVIGESTTARDRIRLLAGTYRSAFPERGRAVTAWLRQPHRPMAGLLFLPFASRDGTTNRVTGRQRVRLHAGRPNATRDGASA